MANKSPRLDAPHNHDSSSYYSKGKGTITPHNSVSQKELTGNLENGKGELKSGIVKLTAVGVVGLEESL